MTDSKREARVITHVFNVGGFFGEPVPMIEKEFCDSLLKENQELKWEIEQFKSGVQNFKCPSCHSLAGPLYPVNLMTEITRLREALEQIGKYVAHNGDTWVQDEARKALARADGNEGV